jgi:hypothetical protein
MLLEFWFEASRCPSSMLTVTPVTARQVFGGPV